MDLNQFAGSLGAHLGAMMESGFPDLVTSTLKVENGFLVISQTLEERHGQRFKPRRFVPRPISGETWKRPAEEDEPTPEPYTYHVVRWIATFCPDTDAVAAQHVRAAAECAKIRTWQQTRRGRGGFGIGLLADYVQGGDEE